MRIVSVEVRGCVRTCGVDLCTSCADGRLEVVSRALSRPPMDEYASRIVTSGSKARGRMTRPDLSVRRLRSKTLKLERELKEVIENEIHR